MNIYVGNLPESADEASISELFEEYGHVNSVKLITDRDTGKPRGFGFVDMVQNGGHKAIEALNEHEIDNRRIVVNEARERKNERRNFNNRY
jgi:RNA recognition motif-containing protein